MTGKMLKTYKRWVHKQRRNETVETIRAFIIEEAKFQMAPAETIHGFQKVNVSCQKNAGSNCFIQMQITKKTRKTENVLSANTITGYGNIILLKRKI